MDAHTKKPQSTIRVPGKPTQQADRGFPIVVHSHLGWDWVWQRPQQFLSRFAKHHRILFVEGPCPVEHLEEPRATLREVPDYPNIVVLQSHFPARRWHEGEWVDRERRRLVQSVLAGPLGAEFENPVQWFYDPMAVTAFARQMNEVAIVYDCMDQLSQFKDAHPEMVKRERELLKLADVVFAGGPKIHRAKVPLNANCHSYGCGVDVAHFSSTKAKKPLAIPDDVAHLTGPVLGFFGVVDERMDYELLAKLADAEPAWNIVIVGPRTKVDASVLPQRPNIHWLGGRDYSALPAYAKRFDVCMMPFAINEATEFINPTKALEYMATERPIVSSAIEDVVLQFKSVVAIANTHEEFVAHCRKALQKPNKAAIKRGVELARGNSWEAIVRKLKAHINDVLDTKTTADEANTAA